MPKIVDRATRRTEVGEAVLRVVARAGVEGASLRAIADEAGLAVGSVRHYFSNHDAILHFAMQELADRVTGRLQGFIDASRDDHLDIDLEDVEAILCEFLPLDDTSRLDAEVWLALVAAARSRPALAQIADRVGTGIRAVVGQVLAGAARRGLVELDDPAVETERVAALLDGLTLAVIRPPGIGANTARQVLNRHLESLAVR